MEAHINDNKLFSLLSILRVFLSVYAQHNQRPMISVAIVALRDEEKSYLGLGRKLCYS